MSSLAVDLALVLAVDCSSSIDAGDFRIQMDGFAGALRHPSLAQAIAAGEHHQIALSLMLWSNMQTQVIAMPWRIIGGPGDLEMTARTFGAMERNLQPGGTGLAAAVDYAATLLQVLPCAADRHTIDVSGDGEDNEGGDAGEARDRAVAHGFTINGLPIVNGSSLLVDYYRTDVIGGPGAFVEPTDSIMSFRDTILKKLLREIGRPVS